MCKIGYSGFSTSTLFTHIVGMGKKKARGQRPHRSCQQLIAATRYSHSRLALITIGSFLLISQVSPQVFDSLTWLGVRMIFPSGFGFGFREEFLFPQLISQKEREKVS